jgi:DtxR family Mn-dependent transcriptional regulator
MLNRSSEDYIKNIYKLLHKGEKATTSAIASNLQLADASVTDMIKKLSEKGYLKYEPYKGVELTASGRRVAMKIVRRHRLWEMFLVRFLEFSWDQVHDEAERLEHVMSEQLEHKLDKALGFPTLDPHGDPIPTIDGDLDRTAYAPLSDFGPGSKVRIHRVSDDDPELLQHAARIGLALNTTLVVKEKLDFDGSMTVKIGSKEQFISRRVADSVFVQPFRGEPNRERA